MTPISTFSWRNLELWSTMVPREICCDQISMQMGILQFNLIMSCFLSVHHRCRFCCEECVLQIFPPKGGTCVQWCIEQVCHLSSHKHVFCSIFVKKYQFLYLMYHNICTKCTLLKLICKLMHSFVLLFCLGR